MQTTIIETLQTLSVPFFWLSVVGFAVAYSIVIYRLILQKPLRAVASFVASFFL